MSRSVGRIVVSFLVGAATLITPLPGRADHEVAGLTLVHEAEVDGDHWSAVTFELREPSKLSWEVKPTFGPTPETAVGLFVHRDDGSLASFAAAVLFWETGSSHVYSGGAEPIIEHHLGDGEGWTTVTVNTSSELEPGRYTALAYAISQNAETTETFLYAEEGDAEPLADASGPGLFLARSSAFRGRRRRGCADTR